MRMVFAHTALWCLAWLCQAPWKTGASDADPGWFFETLPPSGVSSTTLEIAGQEYTIYGNLWWHNQHFYGILDDTNMTAVLPPALSYTTGIIPLPVRDARQHARSVKAGWMPGTTLLLDLAFPAFPDNFGHWAEAIVPIYNVLSARAWKSSIPSGSSTHIDTLIFVNLRREQLAGLDWVWEMLRLALAPGLAPGRDLPRTLFANQLEHLDKAAWLGLANALVVNDRHAREDGRNGFASPELAGDFRAAAFSSHGLQQPDLAGGAPKTITLLTAVNGEEVVNREELLGVLRDVAATLGLALRPYTTTARAPFDSHLAAMARTGVLVARHGPLLANAIFLPPGAVVMELLPYNWEWNGISRTYANLTASRGDIHHMAWRAKHPRWAVYQAADDAKYADWTAEECRSSECLDAHARAGMRVDTAAVQQLLMQVVPGAMRGESVESLRRTWPELVRPQGNTGLWWDK